MVNSSKGDKTQTGIHFQVMRAQTCLYRSKRADGSIHRLSGRDFMSLTPECKNCTMGESMKMGYTFWQDAGAERRKK